MQFEYDGIGVIGALARAWGVRYLVLFSKVIGELGISNFRSIHTGLYERELLQRGDWTWLRCDSLREQHDALSQVVWFYTTDAGYASCGLNLIPGWVTGRWIDEWAFSSSVGTSNSDKTDLNYFPSLNDQFRLTASSGSLKTLVLAKVARQGAEKLLVFLVETL